MTKSLDEIKREQDAFHTVAHGALPDRPDDRDYQAEELLGAKLEEIDVDWNKGYDATKVWPDMPNHNQENQFSCVGHGWSHYKQVLQALDTGEQTELSAKSIYNAIAYPGVGAYVRDGGMRTVNYGVNKEATLPSYGSEAQVTSEMDFRPFAPEAAYYKNQTIAVVQSQDFDVLAKMILINHGFVSGWESHCQYFKKFGIFGGKRAIWTHGSYGPGSDMVYWEGYSSPLFSNWTAIDVKNMPTPPAPNEIPTFKFNHDLKQGQRHPDIIQLNDRLTAQWPPTDLYDAATARKVRQYCIDKKIGSWWYRNVSPAGRVLDETIRNELNQPLYRNK